MRIKAVLWDLDGTLLDTLDDLADSVNFALRANGLPPRTRDEVRRFVGNGVAKLIERAVPEGTDDELRKATYDAFVRHYGAHSQEKTRPYDGVPELLDKLSAQGVKHAVVSNKLEFAVKNLADAYFGERIAAAVGDDPARKKKPAPDSALEALRRLNVKPEDAAYVGDSEVDVLTAKNAGLALCAVCWGFRSEETLRKAGAACVCHTPEALLKALETL